MSQPRFEEDTSRIQVQSVTPTPACSVRSSMKCDRIHRVAGVFSMKVSSNEMSIESEKGNLLALLYEREETSVNLLNERVWFTVSISALLALIEKHSDKPSVNLLKLQKLHDRRDKELIY